MKKRILSLIVIMAFLILCLPIITYAEIIDSGSCGSWSGSSLTWILDDEGILTISGEGSMKDYNYGAGSVNTPFPRKKVKTVVIEDGVYDIGDYAFCLCGNLTNVIMADSVTSIGKGAFYKCSSLTNIIISNNINSIEAYAFDDTAYQEDAANWDNGVLYINNCLIDANPDEISNNYAIKDGTTVIAHYAFNYCNITSISIPSSVILEPLCCMFYEDEIPDTLSRLDIDSKEVPYGFASGCTNIARVNIGRDVQSIDENAFEGCTNLRFLTIAEGVKTISQNAFNGCSALSELTIPLSVKTISQNAFSGCYKIKEVIVPSTVTSIIGDGVFHKSTILCGYRGSAAEEYAANYGYEFHVVDEDSYITSSTAKRSNGVIVLNTDINKDISKKLLHIALYNAEGVLLDYMMIPTTKSNNNAYVVFKDNPNASYAKVFVWNSAVSMKPGANAEKVLIQ